MTANAFSEFRPWALRAVDDQVQRGRDAGGVREQGIRWAPSSWRRGDLHKVHELVDEVVRASEPISGDEHFRIIRRRHVIAAFGGSLRGGFLASMIWGHGPIGYGAARVARILRDGAADLDNRLEAIARASLSADVTECWDAFTRLAKVRGLGPAFATKYAYFAALAREADSYPLIADLNTSWATWHLAGIPRSVENRSSYGAYVELARSLDDAEPDEVECALFTIGRTVNRRSDCLHTSMDECRR